MDKKLVARTIKDLVVKHETANQVGFSAAIVWKPCDLLPQTFSLGVNDEVDLSPRALAAAAIFYSELMHTGAEINQELGVSDFCYFDSPKGLTFSIRVWLACWDEQAGKYLESLLLDMLNESKRFQELKKTFNFTIEPISYDITTAFFNEE